MSSVLIEGLKRLIASGLSAEEARKEPIDLSPECEAWRKTERVVSPWDHVGRARPGDRVLIDEAELAKGGAISRALWTQEAFAAHRQREAEALLARLEGKPETPQADVDFSPEGQRRAQEQRKRGR